MTHYWVPYALALAVISFVYGAFSCDTVSASRLEGGQTLDSPVFSKIIHEE